jgi:RNA polymerase sigma factor (sigma-70 family)
MRRRCGLAAGWLARDGAHAAPDRTDGPVSARTTPSQLRGDEAERYQRHHGALVRAVARVVDAPRELIEDACQGALTTLLQRQPERVAIFAWLRVVAVHEAYRLCRVHRHDARLKEVDHGEGWEAVVASGTTIDDVIEARQALRLLASLPERQREDLSLQVAGFSYREIADMTGGRTLTNVSKHLVKARARVRREQVQGG